MFNMHPANTEEKYADAVVGATTTEELCTSEIIK